MNYREAKLITFALNKVRRTALSRIEEAKKDLHCKYFENPVKEVEELTKDVEAIDNLLRVLTLDSVNTLEDKPYMWVMITPEQQNRIPIWEKEEAQRFASYSDRQVIPLYSRPFTFSGWAKNKKTGLVYRKLGTAVNATNAQDGQVMELYEKDLELYVRNVPEFAQKFEDI